MSEPDDNLSDADLVRGTQEGRSRCQAVLVNRHLRSIYALALRVTGNAADAEDVAQDTFVRAFERLAQYDPDYSFRNWLLKIATNLAISHLRSCRRRARLHHEFGPHQASDDEVVISDHDGEAARCRRFLDHLDDNQRTALVLFHFEELSYTQVAHVMGMPVNTVRTLIHRGRARLRELMTRTNPVPVTGAMENKVWIAGN